MLRKQLPDGSWVDSVNHQDQTAKDNYYDIIVGFFKGNLMNTENLRKVILDVLAYAEFLTETDNSEISDTTIDENEICHFQISDSYAFMSIAEKIAEELGDLEFAKEVFIRSEELTVGIDDLKCLANSILKHLNDEVWYNKLMAKVHSLVKTPADVLTMNFEYIHDN